ncbi:hypothetical protein [Parafrankia sp. FMc2]|uniref:hypothetical protein n=1 Tax=Parafrankia sp. FMc2 TaxID=3233196 RepID=UPI0034D4ECE3
MSKARHIVTVQTRNGKPLPDTISPDAHAAGRSSTKFALATDGDLTALVTVLRKHRNLQFTVRAVIR